MSIIPNSKDSKYGQVIEAVYDLAIKQKNEEVIKKLLPHTSKSNIANRFKDPLQFPSAEAISPPASNSGYVVQDYEKPTTLQSNQQLIAQDNSQRATTGNNTITPLTDPSYNVSFTDNLYLLRVGTYVAQNIFSTVKDSWINMFGTNANPDQVKEAISSSKRQLKTLNQPLIETYKEIIESYEPKIAIHNKKPNQPLGEEIYQLKQFKEQAEQMIKDLQEAHQWSQEFKANLKDEAVIKQAHVEMLEQKIAKIKQESKKFFEAIAASRNTSNALNKPTASELAILEDASTKIMRIFGGDSKATLPILPNVEQPSLHSKAEIPKLYHQINPLSKQTGTRFIK